MEGRHILCRNTHSIFDEHSSCLRMILEHSTQACCLMCQPFGLCDPNWTQVSGAYRPQQRVCQTFGLENTGVFCFTRRADHCLTRRRRGCGLGATVGYVKRSLFIDSAPGSKSMAMFISQTSQMERTAEHTNELLCFRGCSSVSTD
jgi:hypothetical protein